MRATFCLLVVSALASLAGADTNVSGAIAANTTWMKANSPYRVTGAVTVNTGVTLTIEPGVDVLFDADVQFVVQGRLQAVGTETDSIRFIKGTAADWRGIRISGGDTSIIAYARICGGNARGDAPDGYGGGLHVSDAGTRVGVVNSVMYGNYAKYGGGACSDYGAALTMTNCTVSKNTAGDAGGGVYVSDARTRVGMVSSVISGNGAQGGGGVFRREGGPPHGDIFKAKPRRRRNEHLDTRVAPGPVGLFCFGEPTRSAS